MDILAAIAERKIQEAMAKGEFKNLKGAGKPLVLDDDRAVPEELRMAYRVLKNAGCIPPEVELRKEIVTLRNLMDGVHDDEERQKHLKELNYKLLKLEMMRKRPMNLDTFPEYRERILERLEK